MDNTLQTKIQKLHPEDFPLLLKEITDPPEKLYLLGTLPPKDHKWLAVVGSRKYSNYGKEAAETLIAGLQGYPVVIVSGLALGIDAIAHRAALSAKLPTVAVPGSGLAPSVLYPSTNRNLAGDILKAGGALLSEFEPDFQATAWSFPQRNRVIAGLSDATLVVEAEQKSGALITSKFATEYNRDVFTVPGSIFSSSSAGPHMLLKLGATPITSSGDLLEALGFKGSDKVERDYSDCTAEEKTVIGLLQSPLSRDDLIDVLGIPISRANALLSLMELRGFIKETGGEIHLA
ncbi:MAG TPA: DNA-protecting protein DprA [Candidatus Taylorbacteria bacterium]|nr:MAG: protecting protein DprA protein [Parcubacteria group bacterium GW2011_GWA2_47_64]KKU95736.1 MAG: protecting protein DprA protein [Parcubacteria group bacterium GW2011_GWC2_48_17]HBV01687.1 DNA-protecting protein DprA [Candidatus Taylorbacteria bacterium]